MKTRIWTVAIATIFMGTGFSQPAGAIFGLFKKKAVSVNSEAQAGHTERKGPLGRMLRALNTGLVPACSSQQGGRLDGFRRCLSSASALAGSNMGIDLRSTVLAIKQTTTVNSGTVSNPIIGQVSRRRFRQDWFQRQWTLASLSSGILMALDNATQQDAELKSEIAQIKKGSPTSAGKAAALEEKERIVEEVINDYNAQLQDAWQQFINLEQEMKSQGVSDSEYGSLGVTMFAPTPMPDAMNPVFTPTVTQASPYMSTSFEAFLNQFAQQNPSLLKNFCHNFFTVGSGAGYEDDYVRMSDTGNVTSGMVQQYQNVKLSLIASRCSENSMQGLMWRKLFDLCPLEETASQISACSGWSQGNEVRDSQTAGS